MQFTTAFRKLWHNDRRLITRDSFLLAAIGYIMAMSVILRYGIPWLSDTLLFRFEWDLVPYYPLVAALYAPTIMIFFATVASMINDT